MRPADATAAVQVIAPARLHFGFLDPSGVSGRRFGSLGLAIDTPATEVLIRRAASPVVEGPSGERARRLLERFCDALRLDKAWRVDVRRAIPAHAGLGSGTQLALAIGAGLASLAGRPQTGQRLGEIAERGARSSIGIVAFERGGFIVDGGRGASGKPPPLVLRTAFPESWRVLLVLDHKAEGIHGRDEAQAFAALPPFPASAAAHLCHLLLMRLVPGLVEADMEAFGRGLTEIQEIVGRHFAAAQGGTPWSSPSVGRLVGRLAALGATGVGQSSWGPTGFAFVRSPEEATRLYQSCEEAARAEGLELMIARGRNTGALVELREAATSDAGFRRKE